MSVISYETQIVFSALVRNMAYIEMYKYVDPLLLYGKKSTYQYQLYCQVILHPQFSISAGLIMLCGQKCTRQYIINICILIFTYTRKRSTDVYTYLKTNVDSKDKEGICQTL